MHFICTLIAFSLPQEMHMWCYAFPPLLFPPWNRSVQIHCAQCVHYVSMWTKQRGLGKPISFVSWVKPHTRKLQALPHCFWRSCRQPGGRKWVSPQLQSRRVCEHVSEVETEHSLVAAGPAALPLVDYQGERTKKKHPLHTSLSLYISTLTLWLDCDDQFTNFALHYFIIKTLIRIAQN